MYINAWLVSGASEYVSYCTKQCAAVMTQRGEMMEPPQKWFSFHWRLICQPQGPAPAGVPPTMRPSLPRAGDGQTAETTYYQYLVYL